jgi:hypothetical protein
LQIQGTTSLLNLYCQNNLLTDLQIQNLGNLITVESSYNQLQTVNLAGAIHLTSLKCWYNQIVTLNTQGLVALETLEVLQNKMTNLNIANLPRLRYLHCESNLITTLSVTDCPFLRAISCTHNQISTLNLQNLAVFEDLSCASNQLTALNLSNIPSIRFLSCNRNQLTNLDFQYTPKIEYLSCGANLFTDLDVQSLHFLQSLQCSDSPITTIRMKNGINEGYFNCQNNPNLSYVCCDDAQLANVQTTLTQEGYTNVSVNSYCSFVPGSVFYTLQGNSKFDANSNGCDANDPLFPNMKYRITGNGNTGFILANASGNYSIPIAAGSYTIKPVFENNYYTARPDSVQITFSSSTANTLTQDFCVPNTPHQDLEISILPTTAARPGFDANYQIVYKNKGTTLISDSLMLRFPDAIMDFVRANPAPSSMRHDTLVWYFQNLQAFETRTISLTLNLNSPMETPPVNAGDILTLQATIQPFDTDETREDNRFSLRQTVVGSLDPNDKTCLEGEQILPTQVGDYLHYLIRFENTGTFAAQNIVVKDTIDTLKFDIKTLEMTKASHDCRARILNNQQVEFIFENINLPFTAPDKYGFVAFKIKTKPNIPTGSTFENKADIFFDFNFPITTNTATTRIVNVLSTQKNPEQYPFGCSISPNPVTDILTIKTDINIEKAEICDALGRVIFTTSNYPNKQINVAHLPKGSYFIKIFSDNGSATAHFIR